ncbi:hypothetical protein DER44DRAFT_285939 [Fusarium oxysporum]|nr:hypothetical protein DER44DRAFT_285939 [Fusarium oxysporum]
MTTTAFQNPEPYSISFVVIYLLSNATVARSSKVCQYQIQDNINSEPEASINQIPDIKRIVQLYRTPTSTLDAAPSLRPTVPRTYITEKDTISIFFLYRTT